MHAAIMEIFVEMSLKVKDRWIMWLYYITPESI